MFRTVKRIKGSMNNRGHDSVAPACRRPRVRLPQGARARRPRVSSPPGLLCALRGGQGADLPTDPPSLQGATARRYALTSPIHVLQS